ncbi:MAG: hypothetical protein AAF752_15495, partial [Bacteroidota bacterium]
MSDAGSRVLALLALLTLSGCVFGRNAEPTELYPADSLSRALATELGVDSLSVVARVDGGWASGLYLNTVDYDAKGRLHVTDLMRGNVFVLDDAFEPVDSLTGFTYPYLAGERDSALAVFDPQDLTVRLIEDARNVRPLFADLPMGAAGDDALGTFVAITDSAAWVKQAGEEGERFLQSLDQDIRIPLPGPMWRYRGPLELAGNTVYSFSAYRPVVDRLRPGGQRDTLRLNGFDSPMLARSRAYVLGDVDEAPLLISSADWADGRLFVLNLRPGILRIDEYDPSGQLLRIHSYAEQILLEYTPIDFAVRPLPAGGL